MVNLKNFKKDELIYMATHRCTHHHTYLEHPSCYLKERPEQMRVCYLDIEAGGLHANFDYMLSWCVKEKGTDNIITDVINRRDILSGDFDKRIIKSLISELSKYDVVVTYNGTNYDLKFIRSRALSHGIEFLEFGRLKHIDVYYMVKNRLSLHKNSLESACALLGIEGKNHIKGNFWMRAVVGDKKALKYVVEHNIADVIILEKLHDKLERYCKRTNKSI